MIKLRRSALIAIVLFNGGVTPALVAQNANVAQPAARAPPGCRDEQGLTYLCDLVVPEDIVTVGSTGLLLASGHRAPGHLYLIDPKARTQSELIHAPTFSMQHDKRAYPECPGPLDLQAFDTHGLSLAETSPRHFSLYTTSHGAREAIEIYDLDLRGATPALAWKGCVLGQTWVYGWCDDREATQQQVAAELQTALALDDNDCDVHRILAAINVIQDKHDQAVYHQRRALSLNPNDDLIVVQNGEIATWLGQPEDGIDCIRKAMRLNPYHPARFWNHLGRALFVARRYAEAVEAVQRIAAPDHFHLALLAACFAQMGDAAAADAQVREIQRRKPGFNIEHDVLPTLHYKRESDLAHHRESLLKAGLPASA